MIRRASSQFLLRRRCTHSYDAIGGGKKNNVVNLTSLVRGTNASNLSYSEEKNIVSNGSVQGYSSSRQYLEDQKYHFAFPGAGSRSSLDERKQHNSKWSLQQSSSRLDGHRQIRHFHATKRQEILPLVGLVVVAFVGRYSYRALMRMQEEWEDYEEALARYEEQYGTVKTTSDGRQLNLPTLGLHIGYANARVSFLDPPTIKLPQVVENREGSRSTPSLVIFNMDGTTTIGQMAKMKQYQTTTVLNPMSVMTSAAQMTSDEQTTAKYACEVMARNVTYQALEKVMGTKSNVPMEKQTIGSGPLFGIAAASTTADGGGDVFPVQPVVTYPMAFTNEETPVLPIFVDAMNSLVDTTSIQNGGDHIEIKYISEPLAAVTAAKKMNLFEKIDKNPSVPKDGPILVLDLLHSALETSLVEMSTSTKNDGKVIHHADCPVFGVKILIEGVANLLVQDFYGDDDSTTTKKDFKKEVTPADGELPFHVEDKMALQRIMDASEEVFQELSSTKNSSHRATVSLPYLSMDVQIRQPRHLEKGISSPLMEREGTRLLLEQIGPILEQEQSPFGKPQTLADVVTIVLTKFLEDASTTPFQLKAVLMCGEGGRSPILRKAVSDALGRIAGEPFVAERLIVPPAEQIHELVVLGAAYSAR